MTEADRYEYLGRDCEIDDVTTDEGDFFDFCVNSEPHWCEYHTYDGQFDKIEDIMLACGQHRIPKLPRILRWKQFPPVADE